jgi:hypothetical protein
LRASSTLDEAFAKIDAGEPLAAEQGLLGGMLMAALERGLGAELTEHVKRPRLPARGNVFLFTPQLNHWTFHTVVYYISHSGNNFKMRGNYIDNIDDRRDHRSGR